MGFKYCSSCAKKREVFSVNVNGIEMVLCLACIKEEKPGASLPCHECGGHDSAKDMEEIDGNVTCGTCATEQRQIGKEVEESDRESYEDFRAR